MLDVRTNILFDKEMYRLLSTLAKQGDTSIGDLVRKAVVKVYKKSDEEIIRRRTAAVKRIMNLQKKMKPTKGINYRELIEYGRYR